MNKYLITLLVLSSSFGTNYCATKRSADISQREQCAITEKHCVLRRTLDKVWADHVIWIRQFIVAALEGSPDADAAVARLMKNQEDIGNALVPFYGVAVGTQFSTLLKEHIQIAAHLVKALKANKKEDAKKIDAQWHANALDIASFLNKVNPALPKDVLVKMLNEHLALTSQEVMARLNKNWQEDVKVFDRVFEQIRDMAKTLADGIKAQFPDQFKK